jgi:hypothetical protein
LGGRVRVAVLDRRRHLREGGGEGTGQVGTIGVEKMQKRLTQRAMVVVWFNTDMAIEVVWFIQNRKEGQNQMRAGKVDAQ